MAFDYSIAKETQKTILLQLNNFSFIECMFALKYNADIAEKISNNIAYLNKLKGTEKGKKLFIKILLGDKL